MKPTNSKSLMIFIFGQMEKLDQKEIGVDEAQAQANLARQANNVLSYELKRAETLIKIGQANREGLNVSIRDIEE